MPALSSQLQVQSPYLPVARFPEVMADSGFINPNKPFLRQVALVAVFYPSNSNLTTSDGGWALIADSWKVGRRQAALSSRKVRKKYGLEEKMGLVK